MATPAAHLIERAAERLRAASGLIDAPPERIVLPDVPAHRAPRPAHVFQDDPVRVAEPVALQAPADTAVAYAKPAAAETAPADTAPILMPPAATAPAGASQAEVSRDGVLQGTPAVRTGVATSGTTVEPAAPRFLDISTLERTGLVVGRKARSRISEEFRIAVGHVLRTLQTSYTAGHGAANLILVTSSRPGEGKSFTALNLAGCIAQQDQRDVLLVDIDAKQRPITYELGLSDAPGLLDLVRDPSLRIEDVIVPTAIASLSVLPIGARLTSNAEMPLSRPITAVVERLARRFANKVIILDAPPCLSASDPSALAPLVGQTVMVVEAERTQRNELEAALEMIRVCPTITLLLNKIQLTTSYTFGAYHYFGTYS